jgi:hypothetical protein
VEGSLSMVSTTPVTNGVVIDQRYGVFTASHFSPGQVLEPTPPPA